MATNDEETDTFVYDEGDWTDAQMGEALRRLDEMHRQVRALRSTIPRMIKPLNTLHNTPEDLFRAFATAAEKAGKDVKAFKKFRNDEKSCEVLARAAASRRETKVGIVPWRVTQHQDVFDPPDNEFKDGTAYGPNGTEDLQRPS